MLEKIDLKEIKTKFFEGYKIAVENRYKYLFQSNPESFPFYQEKKWKIILIKLPDFFNDTYVVLISDNDDLEDNQTIDLSDILNLDNLQKNHTDLIRHSKLYIENHSKYVNQNKDSYFLDQYRDSSYLIPNIFTLNGEHQAEYDYQNFQKLSSERMENKSHEQVSPFNHLNLDDMKRVVNDETFSYQIDQGLECYKHELYLPAAATFAIAIESFLIKLKKANKIKHKDSDSTMYDKLLESLKQHSAINYRNKVRIEIAYKMRNIVNHTQAGSVARNDCDFLLNTLKDVIDENQEKLQNLE